MEIEVTLTPKDVRQAIKEYLEQKGMELTGELGSIRLNAARQYDYYDRPSAIKFTNATCKVRMADQPAGEQEGQT